MRVGIVTGEGEAAGILCIFKSSSALSNGFFPTTETPAAESSTAPRSFLVGVAMDLHE